MSPTRETRPLPGTRPHDSPHAWPPVNLVSHPTMGPLVWQTPSMSYAPPVSIDSWTIYRPAATLRRGDVIGGRRRADPDGARPQSLTTQPQPRSEWGDSVPFPVSRDHRRHQPRGTRTTLAGSSSARASSSVASTPPLADARLTRYASVTCRWPRTCPSPASM
jgi:hypothetical protein